LFYVLGKRKWIPIVSEPGLDSCGNVRSYFNYVAHGSRSFDGCLNTSAELRQAEGKSLTEETKIYHHEEPGAAEPQPKVEISRAKTQRAPRFLKSPSFPLCQRGIEGGLKGD
jgi:hypothetical protein